MRALIPLVLLLAVTPMQVSLNVEDSSGAPLKNELIIVQDLDHQEHEVIRALSDRDGKVPSIDLGPAVYRVIATDPYGLWETEIREFLVANKPVQLTIQVRPKPTGGYGDVITLGAKKQRLKVFRSDGQPAANADVYVRDQKATLSSERRYKTDGQGQAVIELVAKPTFIVIVFGDCLVTRELNAAERELIVRLSPNS